MSYPFQDSFEVYVEQLDQIRADIRYADVATLSASGVKSRRVGRIKSFVYIWASAALENYVKESLKGLIREVNVKVEHFQIPVNHLKAGWMVLCQSNLFSSLQSVRGNKQWAGRVELLKLVTSTEIITFREELPIDGRTLRPEHFELIWEFFEFSGEPFLHTRQKFVLNELADFRNQLAHGEVEPSRFGRLKTLRDLERLVEGLESLGQHLALTIEDYFYEEQYKRQ